MTRRFLVITGLALALTTGLMAESVPAHRAGKVSGSLCVASATRELADLKAHKYATMVALYDEVQFAQSLQLLVSYEQTILPLKARLKAANKAYDEAFWHFDLTNEQLKETFQAQKEAEMALERADYQLHCDLYALLTDAQKKALPIKRQQVSDLRNLVATGDKEAFICSGMTGASDPMTQYYGMVAVLYEEAQTKAAAEIMKGINDKLTPLNKDIKTAFTLYHNQNADITSHPAELKNNYDKYRGVLFSYKEITQDRDRQLINLLKPEQKPLFDAMDARVKQFFDHLTRLESLAERDPSPLTKNERAETREINYLLSYNSTLINCAYDDAQYEKAMAFVKNAREKDLVLQPLLLEAMTRYQQVVQDATATQEQRKAAFDVVSAAVFAIETLERQQEMDMKGLLTEDQKKQIKLNKGKMRRYRLYLTAYDDAFDHPAVCGALPRAGTVALVYTEPQYKSAMDMMEKLNKTIRPLFGDIREKKSGYKKLFAEPTSALDALRSAYDVWKAARWEHTLLTRERNKLLAYMLTPEQGELLEKYENRVDYYQELMGR